MKNYLTCIILLFNFLVSQSQQDSIQTQTLETVDIYASKIKEKKEKLPLSITVQDFSLSQDSRQQLSFNDYLIDVPGVFVLNSNNFSQDSRVSIRGFGARAAFGIRGVKIIVDGIPETTPDGQGQIDNLNLGAIKNIEVVRGPSSLLFGNASGGIIYINTIDKVEEVLNAGIITGAYGMQQYQLGLGFKKNKTTFIFKANHIKTEGYRAFSGFENTNVNLRIFHLFSSKSKLNVQLNYSDSPFAEDAGSLSAVSVTENRRQARQRNIDYDTKEEVSQLKIGANYNHNFSKKLDINSYAFLAFRSFDAKLPFEFGGVITLDRNYYGNGSSLGITLEKDKLKNKLRVGYELAFQKDERQRFRNIESRIGEQTLDQDEIFNTYGFYLINHLTFSKFLLRAGIRYDGNTLEAEDKFLNNGDDSGEIKLNAVNYSLGINYNLIKNNYLFVGISTSFETPVLSELSNNPKGQGGFNQELKAQEAINYELGYKWKSTNTEAEVVFFYINTKNDLIPFELMDFPGRNFYRSAGSTKRRGIELFLDHKFNKRLKVAFGYTYSDFKYFKYSVGDTNFNNKLLPAIPKHRLSTNITYKNKNGLYMQLQGQHTGSLYTNDANSVKDKAYTVLNLRLRKSFKLKSLTLLPFTGINNVLNKKYNDNIRINAFGGRFFEPGAGLNFYGGFRIKV